MKFLTPILPEGVLSNCPCPSDRLSVFKYLRDYSLVFSKFLHEVRALVITLVRQCVSVSVRLQISQCVRLSLNISETVHQFFLNFCMKLGHHKGTKVTEPHFLKKSLGITNGEKTHFGGIFDVFCPYLKNGSNDFDVILHINSLIPNTIFFQKSGSVTFVPFWCPNFIQKFRKN